jgi:ubiquinone/menaquinone biosynthesis C-methylase UbiE
VKFEDHFSQQAAQYAAYRPRYPRALFEFVAGLTARHGAVLDCGTGSGQAAIGMTDYFDRVIATDPSEEQIRNGARHPQIEFRVARAEASGLPDGSVNLVTAAQALHWFDTVAFFAEAKRDSLNTARSLSGDTATPAWTQRSWRGHFTNSIADGWRNIGPQNARSCSMDSATSSSLSPK